MPLGTGTNFARSNVSWARSARLSRYGMLSARQFEPKYRPARRVRSGLKAAAVGLDDGAANRKPNAEPAWFGRVKRLEKKGVAFRRKSRPGIGAGDDNAPVVGPCGHD